MRVLLPAGNVMNDKSATRGAVIIGQAYRNAPAAIQWLCNVLGFAEHAVYPGPDGTIVHTEAGEVAAARVKLFR
jgi:uncharacterized glyoxalase superfamily protein PhnB